MENNGEHPRGSNADVSDNDVQPSPTDACVNDAPLENLRRLSEKLRVLQVSKDATDYDKIRRPFDNAFYCIDKRTISKVLRAQKRVGKIETLLDKLASAHRKADPGALA